LSHENDTDTIFFDKAVPSLFKQRFKKIGLSEINHLDVGLISTIFLYKYYSYVSKIKYKFKINRQVYTYKNWADYFLILNNKSQKIKYTLNDEYNLSIITISIGAVLSHFGKYKKLLKKSIKAYILLVRFIKNTILKIVKNKSYVFFFNGLNKRIFKLIDFMLFFKKSIMGFYVLKPLFSYSKRIFKKIKSIKRKFQSKNTIKVAKTHSSIKGYKLKKNI
jgi:hypothetical protein